MFGCVGFSRACACTYSRDNPHTKRGATRLETHHRAPEPTPKPVFLFVVLFFSYQLLCLRACKCACGAWKSLRHLAGRAWVIFTFANVPVRATAVENNDQGWRKKKYSGQVRLCKIIKERLCVCCKLYCEMRKITEKISRLEFCTGWLSTIW